MADVNLEQAVADVLIAMEKHHDGSSQYDFPTGGMALTVPLQSADRREQFVLDVSRGRIDLVKVKMQNRARQVVVLLRLDLAGPPHRNPDDTEVPTPHLHIYREGFGDKWAIPVPVADFSNLGDVRATLDDFMRYCNITQPPNFRPGLGL